MQATQKTKSFTRLSAGMVVIMGVLAGSVVDATAFPTLHLQGPHRPSGVNLVDNRTYRHCHNGPRFVECYTRKFGQKDPVTLERGRTWDRNRSAEKGPLRRQRPPHRDRSP